MPPILCRVEDGEMGLHAGPSAGDAGHEPLAAAAESGEVVKAGGAGDDHPVGLGDPAIDLDGHAARGTADGDQLAGVCALVVDHPDPAEKGAENLAVFSFGLGSVDAQADENFDVLVGDPEGVQPLRQDRQIVLAAGVAGDVRGDDKDLLPPMDDLFERRTADGPIEGPAHQGFRFVGGGRHLRGQNLRFRQIARKGAVVVF